MASGLPDNFITMDDFVESTNILVYADAGTGKTVLLKDCDLIVRIDQNTESAKRHGSKAQIANCTDWPTLIDTLNWIDHNPDRFKLVGIDGLTKMHRICMKYFMEKLSSDNPHRDIDLPSQAEHQKVQNIMKRYVELLCDMPTNMVFTATTMMAENQSGDERILPQIHGQRGDLSRYICSQMGYVGYMEVKDLPIRGSDKTKRVRRIHWQPYDDGLYFGKDKSGALGDYTQDKSLPEILSMIEAPVETTAKRRPAARTRRSTARG